MELEVYLGAEAVTTLSFYLFSHYGINTDTKYHNVLICKNSWLAFQYGPVTNTVKKILSNYRIITFDYESGTLCRHNNKIYIVPSILDKVLNTILIYREDKRLALPTKAYDSVGYDLYCTRNDVILPQEFKDVDTGVYCAFPPHVWGMLISRSSIFRQRLLINTGILDPGYQGQLYAACYNPTAYSFVVKRGMRLVQLIPMSTVSQVSLQEVNKLTKFPKTKRGSKGFGSSGV